MYPSRVVANIPPKRGLGLPSDGRRAHGCVSLVTRWNGLQELEALILDVMTCGGTSGGENIAENS